MDTVFPAGKAMLGLSLGRGDQREPDKTERGPPAELEYQTK